MGAPGSHTQTSEVANHFGKYTLTAFAFLAVLGQVSENVALPLLANSVAPADPYFVLLFGSLFLATVFHVWLAVLRLFTNRITPDNTALPQSQMFLVGLCTGLNGLLVVYASPTARTAAFLQSLLFNFSIPMTITFRWLILRKSMTRAQVICAVLVMIGIFVALIPNIFNVHKGASDPKSSGVTGIARVLWPLCFMLGFAPGAVWNVLQERNLKDARGPMSEPLKPEPEVDPEFVDLAADSPSRRVAPNLPGMKTGKRCHLIYFLAWTNTWMLVVSLCLFWTDFVPKFGMAGSPHQFFQRLGFGFRCFAMVAPACADGIAFSRAITFGVGYVLALIGSGLLVRNSDGANYLALVQTMCTPLGALFWTLFSPAPLRWDPAFTATTIFSLLGLLLMVPGIVFYNKPKHVSGIWRWLSCAATEAGDLPLTPHTAESGYGAAAGRTSTASDDTRDKRSSSFAP